MPRLGLLQAGGRHAQLGIGVQRLFDQRIELRIGVQRPPAALDRRFPGSHLIRATPIESRRPFLLLREDRGLRQGVIRPDRLARKQRQGRCQWHDVAPCTHHD